MKPQYLSNKMLYLLLHWITELNKLQSSACVFIKGSSYSQAQDLAKLGCPIFIVSLLVVDDSHPVTLKFWNIFYF